MNNQWWDVLMYGGSAGAATFAGMMLILIRENWSRRNSSTLVSYSAGVLLGVGFLHVLPEAVELQRKAVSLSKDAPLYRLRLAELLVKAGDREAAKAELESLRRLGGRFDRQAEVTTLLARL